jgi:hypothetical protein
MNARTKGNRRAGQDLIEYEKIAEEFIEACGYALGVKATELRDEIAALETQLNALKNELARLPASPPGPPGKMAPVKTWQADTVFYEGEIATHRGATYQARSDTAKAPWTEDWALVAAAGASGKAPRVRGTYNPITQYSQLDVVALNGSSFIALRDAPGICPGPGWQLIASCGKRGAKGERGERGYPAASIVSWEINLTTYIATPILDDGSAGAPLDLHPLFQQFLNDVWS